jgi:hypothetical protein
MAGTAFKEVAVGISNKPSIAYYISAHGYGHGVRSCDVIRAVNHLYPGLTFHIVSALPAPFWANRLDLTNNLLHSRSFDVGMVQIDSVRVDVDASLTRVEDLLSQRSTRVAEESAFLKEKRISLVIADIPAVPIEAAALQGIPRMAIANFGWDWIYSEFIARNQRWEPVVEMFREQYAKTDLLLRLPFHESMSAFPKIEDLPLVASPGVSRRSEISRLAGCDSQKKWVLLSFTTLDWNDEALDRVENIDECEFFTVRPLAWERKNLYPLSRDQVSFPDVVASVDAVISKPGFGILSDCIVNRKPLIYADRSDFLEYPILETAIQKHLKHIHIPAGQLYDGNLRESLERLWDRPAPADSCAMGGAEIAARRIAQFAGLD